MALVTPERWYILFWLSIGAITVTPIYIFLYLILKQLKGH